MVAPDPPLAAGGVVLRVPDDGDAAWITKSWNDPDIAGFIVGMPSPFTQRWASGTDAELVVADAASGEPLGLVSLRVAERDPGLAAVGYWLRAEARGRGAATVAVQLVARWAFDALGVAGASPGPYECSGMTPERGRLVVRLASPRFRANRQHQ